MKGIMEFDGCRDEYVGKKSEYKTVDEFIGGVEDYIGEKYDPAAVYDGYVRYYPKGTCEHPECEPGQPFYMTSNKGQGAFECWFIDQGSVLEPTHEVKGDEKG